MWFIVLFWVRADVFLLCAAAINKEKHNMAPCYEVTTLLYVLSLFYLNYTMKYNETSILKAGQRRRSSCHCENSECDGWKVPAFDLGEAKQPLLQGKLCGHVR